MITFFIVIVAIIAVVLYFKYKIAKNKPVENRSSVEKILTGVGVQVNRNLNEAAEAIRTPEIAKEEGIQRCKEAIKNLDTDFKAELASLIKRREDLKAQLPSLKKKPGSLLGKAQTNKNKMEQAEKEGKSELASQYKRNAMTFLDLKKKALERIKRSEKFLEEIDTAIQSSQANYELKKYTLDDLLAEFETMTTAISAFKYNQSIEIIQSLRRETADKLRDVNAEIEASSIVNDNNLGTEINESELEDEFSKL